MNLQEPLETLAYPPTTFTKGKQFAPPNCLRIYDSTLRDGEQMPGICFTPEQKYTMARALSDIGVHIIDVGFPSVSESERRSLQLIMEGKKKGEIRQDLEVLVMCRSTPGDIQATLDALKEISIAPDEVTFFIFTSGSDLHVKYKLGKTLLQREKLPIDAWEKRPVAYYREANIRMSVEAIAFAKSQGVGYIEFGGEDGSRSDVNYLIEYTQACREAGGNRLGFPDTVGVFTPEGVDHYLPKLREALGDFPLVIHFHNDFGLAAINTVRALSYGAQYFCVTANGLGERAGNAPLHQVVMILKELYGITIPGFHYDHLLPLRRLVEKYSGIPIQPHEPIIGEGVYAHETGIHTAGILIHPAIYQAIDPVSVGGKITFRFGKHSGRAVVRDTLEKRAADLEQAGVSVSEALVTETMNEVKQIREARAREGQASAITERAYRDYLGLAISEEELIQVAKRVGTALEES